MFDLDYADPLAPVFAPSEIVGEAIRVRRRRRVTFAGTAVLAVLAALGLAAWWPVTDRGISPAGNPYGTNIADPVADQHRASDPIVVLGTSNGWKSFVYYSLTNEICWGAVALAGSRGYATSSCGEDVDTSHAWVQEPMPMGIISDGADDALWIGFVEGPASTVHLQFMGHTETAAVTPVEVHGLVGLGAYAMWIPTGGGSYGSADISDVIATTVGGKVVATTS